MTTNIWGDGSPDFLIDNPDIQKLEAARRRSRITVVDWAQRSGISEGSIRSYMKGRARPPAFKLACIAQAVGLTFQDVVEGDSTPVPNVRIKPTQLDNEGKVLPYRQLRYGG